ncbi:MAG: hypothetical protein A3F12_02040 [Gammaproteobacteria bacterium RIFCSPHIGHO2_12_FULL_38_14]|nr:MAG: hypothetical protein A3F12_02040 [Gammaproteobacteria bacterium RIFCSPHIGHO2_12_FULL_38_14]
MSHFLSQFSTRFNKINERNRLIMVIALILLIFFLWLFLCYLPLARIIKKNTEAINIVQKSVLALSSLYTQYQSTIRSPTLKAEQKIQALEIKLANLQQHPLLVKKLVTTSDDLQSVMHAVSTMDATMSLNQIQSLSTTSVGASKKIPLSNQKILVEFTGNYFETIRYLDYLENLPWYLSFDSLEYQVDAYPNAKVTLILNVLCTRDGA